LARVRQRVRIPTQPKWRSVVFESVKLDHSGSHQRPAVLATRQIDEKPPNGCVTRARDGKF
jgi:hypothetical protein